MTLPKLHLFALVSGILILPQSVVAAEQTLPAPPPSTFVDTESSLNVPLPDWPELGRRIKLTLSTQATPSNNVQIAFGKDLNGDEDLEPEETQIIVGVDRGEWFVRDERQNASRPLVTEDWTEGETSPTNETRTIRLKQPAAMSERFDFSKVTTRDRANPGTRIDIEIVRPGIAVILH